MPNKNTENDGAPIRVAITIPGNGTTGGTSIRALAIAAGVTPPPYASIRIPGNAPGGSVAMRSAFIVASPRPGSTTCVATDFTTHGEPVSDGAAFYDPSILSQNSFVRSATSSAVSALLVIIP